MHTVPQGKIRTTLQAFLQSYIYKTVFEGKEADCNCTLNTENKNESRTQKIRKAIYSAMQNNMKFLDFEVVYTDTEGPKPMLPDSNGIQQLTCSNTVSAS